MARCSHLCIGGQLIKVIDLDEEMESNNETNYILLVDNPDSPKDADTEEQYVNTGPVFSLKCLHEDDEQHLFPENDAVNSNVRNIAENTKFVSECSEKDSKEIQLSNANSHADIDTVPELVMNCEDDSEGSESSESSPEEEVGIIDMDEVPELIICSEDDNSQEPTSSSAVNASNTDDKLMGTAGVPGLINNSNEQSVLKSHDHIVKIDKELEEHPNLTAVQNASSNVTQVASTYSSSALPARTAFSGKHYFRIAFSHPQNLKKSEKFVYCELRNKLYISKDHPFKLLVTATGVFPGSIIRVTAVYCQIEHSAEPVRRCHYHSQQEYETGYSAYKHIIQSLSESAVYSENEKGILSVSVPYEFPQVGELFSTYMFEFTDYSSCSAGMNRRPIMLIFTLEKDGIVLGRQNVEARICAVPYRDYRHEKKEVEKISYSYLKKDPSPRQNTLQPKETFPNYTITVKDHELYQFLRHMKVLYESSVIGEKLSNADS